MDSPQRYCSRPIEVTAIQWTGDNKESVRAFTNRLTAHQYGFDVECAGHAALWVVKSNVWCSIEVGDWIVAEPDGDGHYPVKAALFADRYEPQTVGQ